MCYDRIQNKGKNKTMLENTVKGSNSKHKNIWKCMGDFSMVRVTDSRLRMAYHTMGRASNVTNKDNKMWLSLKESGVIMTMQD